MHKFKNNIEKDEVLKSNAEVFTPTEVVTYMIDSVESSLGHKITFDNRILEPSAGEGAFILSIIKRMYDNSVLINWNENKIYISILAFEINIKLVEKLRYSVIRLLLNLGCNEARARELSETWIRAGDFLAWKPEGSFDIVIGNPPYIRYDTIDKIKVDYLQKKYSTFKGRCDLYVPFIEKSLSLLASRGVFCFICSNRFTKSEYGRQLRKFISQNYHVTLYLNLEHANVFGKKIAAYPSIFMIDYKYGLPTYTATVSTLGTTTWENLQLGQSTILSSFPEWYQDDEPWATTNITEWKKSLQVQKKLPLLIESGKGTQFGIGVATGNDNIFISNGPVPGVESDCLLPLVTSDDIRSGRTYGQMFLVNPWNMDGSGKLRRLADRPGLAQYLEQFREQLEARYIAHRSSWYRTIDRVNPRLLKTPKIVLPDIQEGGVVGIDEKGTVYPHHNVYWIVSTEWPLHLLAAILQSDFIIQQIRWGSTEMRGGSIRFQAKNLERLRIPPRSIISIEEEQALVTAYMNNKKDDINLIVNNIVNSCLKSENKYHSMQRQLSFNI